jgi:hydrogenase nickel incorporation protein HypA/HybF
MHEASIVRELIDRSVELARGRRVVEIRVRVGLLTGISPDAMRFYFEVLSGEAFGSPVELTVQLEPLRGRCRRCRREATSHEIVWACAWCGEALQFENGQELDLSSLVVTDERADHDRAEDPEEERRDRRGDPARAR